MSASCGKAGERAVADIRRFDTNQATSGSIVVAAIVGRAVRLGLFRAAGVPGPPLQVMHRQLATTASFRPTASRVWYID
jgi:hypothetical protein